MDNEELTIEENEKFEEIKSQIKKRDDLYISQLPIEKKEEFKQLAKDLFRNDYGILITYLLDLRRAMTANPNVELNTKIEILADNLDQLKSEIENLKTKEPSGIKTLGRR